MIQILGLCAGALFETLRPPDSEFSATKDGPMTTRLNRRDALRLGLAAAGGVASGAGLASASSLPAPPVEGDFSAASLRNYERQLLTAFGGDYRNVPLAVKADFYEWVMFHYHHAPAGQVYDWCILPPEAGPQPQRTPCSDTSTWNGALLCALSYKYAVTRDPQTLDHIAKVLEGMRLCLAVSGKPGLIVRSVRPADGVHHDKLAPLTAPDGQEYFVWGQPAKGTYNQIVGGYAKMMMHTFADLPPQVQQMAAEDLSAMVLHVIDHDYHLTNADGSRTPYGNLTPRVGAVGVPFNAQVAYQIVATGQRFPPADAAPRQRIEEQYDDLRRKHHVYYEEPWRNIVQPQRVAASPFIKGWNDRAHAIYASFAGMELDIDRARRAGVNLDGTFLNQLGATMLHGMDFASRYRNSLCYFMWAGLLSDPEVFEAVVRHKRNTVRGQVERGLEVGLDELKRYPLDRFSRPGREIETDQAASVDQFLPGYRWHQFPNLLWEPSGPATNNVYNSICFLHAYWLFRYYRLQEHPHVQRLGGVG
jgi:hypothetical protein